MKKKKKTTIIALTAVILICAYAVLCGAFASSMSKIQLENAGYKTAVSAKKANIYISPFSLAFPCGKADEGEKIEILASSKKWSKAVFTSGGKIKTGYIKNSDFKDAENGIIPATSLNIEKGDFVCEKGESVQIDFSLYPECSNEAVVWESSNAEVARVENGAVTGVSCGTAVISASIGCETQRITVTVTEYDSEFSFKKSSYTINKGKSLNLSKELNGSADGIKWESSNTDCLSVDSSTITGKSTGTAIITAIKNGARASCRIYIKGTNTNASSPLDIVSSYGNIYNYHPSLVYFENGWNGYKYWCAYTPYPKCDDKYENPHITVSNDLKKWETPKGFSNPLEPMPSDYEHGEIYNSDTELVYNSDTGTLECWWRFFDRPHDNHVILRRKTTTDGVHWSAAEDMLVADMNRIDFLSPAIIYENGKYKMWAINENTRYSIDYRESKDGKNWSEIRKIPVEFDDKELYPWHLDVIHTAKGYEMAISAYYPKTRDRQQMNLYYSFSADNKDYSKAQLLLSPTRNTSKWDNKGLYRSSLLYADGKYYLIYSGLNKKTGPSGLGLIGGSNPFNMK